MRGAHLSRQVSSIAGRRPDPTEGADAVFIYIRFSILKRSNGKVQKRLQSVLIWYTRRKAYKRAQTHVPKFNYFSFLTECRQEDTPTATMTSKGQCRVTNVSNWTWIILPSVETPFSTRIIFLHLFVSLSKKWCDVNSTRVKFISFWKSCSEFLYFLLVMSFVCVSKILKMMDHCG